MIYAGLQALHSRAEVPMFNRSPFSVCLRALVIFGLTATIPRLAGAESFQPVSPEELKMTTEPLAPGSPAIILDHEVNRNDFGRSSHGGLHVMDAQGSRGRSEEHTSELQS